MDALDKLLKDIPSDYDEVDVANHLLHFREQAKAELSALRERAEKADDAKLISDNLLFDIYKFFKTEVTVCSGIGCEMEIGFMDSISAYFFEHAPELEAALKGDA